MKTPDDIKKGLEICTTDGVSCTECPYCDVCVAYGGKTDVDVDALAYIQQLEADLQYTVDAANIMKDEALKLEQRLAQVERERDAAVVDIRNAKWMLCHVCKNYYRPDPAVRHYACKEFGDFSDFLNPSDFAEEEYDFPSLCGKFKWRGVCPENTKEET